MPINKPIISIIIPAWNAENTIETTIKSIQNQSYTNWELIIVNDGSTDNTYNISTKFASEDKRVKVISIPNSGAYIARLTGVEIATAPWITFVDADDLLEQDNIKVLFDIASEAEICDIIVGNLKFDGNTIRKGDVFNHKISGILTATNYQEALLKGETTIGPTAKLFKRDLFIRAKLSLNTDRFDQNEDLLMLLKLSRYCQNGIYIDPLQRVVYTYYRRLNSASSKQEKPDKWFHLFTELHKPLIDETSKGALINYKINVLFNNCILPGTSLIGYEKEIAQIIQQSKCLATLSKKEKFIIYVIKSPILCSVISYCFRFLRKLSRLTRH